jgi:hypothetical protein
MPLQSAAILKCFVAGWRAPSLNIPVVPETQLTGALSKSPLTAATSPIRRRQTCDIGLTFF